MTKTDSVPNKVASEWILMTMVLMRNVENCSHVYPQRNSSSETLQTLQKPHFTVLLKLRLLNKNILDPNLAAISCFGGV